MNRFFKPFSSLRACALALALGALLSACGGADDELFEDNELPPPSPSPVAETPVASPTPAMSPTPSPSPSMTPTPTPSVSPTPTPTPATLAQVQASVFDAHCVGCHSGAVPSGSLGLDNTTVSYGELVNQASSGAPAATLVIPNDASNSYLVRKLEGAVGIVGLQMPRNASPLSATLIGMVRSWINAGALPDAAVTSTKVVGHSVVDDGEILLLEYQLMGLLDPSSLNPGAVLVYRVEAGQRQLLSEADYTVAVDASRLLVRVASDRLAGAQVAVEINPTSGATLLDSQGRLLDGDGDELPGGTFFHSFP